MTAASPRQSSEIGDEMHSYEVHAFDGAWRVSYRGRTGILYAVASCGLRGDAEMVAAALNNPGTETKRLRGLISEALPYVTATEGGAAAKLSVRLEAVSAEVADAA